MVKLDAQEKTFLDDVERIVVGSVIVHGIEAYASISEHVNYKHFQDPSMRLCWQVFDALSSAGGMGGTETVYRALWETKADRFGTFPPVSILDYLTDGLPVDKAMPVCESLVNYSRMIRDNGNRVSMIGTLKIAIKQAERPETRVDDVYNFVSSFASMLSSDEEDETLLSVWDKDPPSADTGGLSWGLPGMDE